MAASAASVTEASPSRPAPTRDPPKLRILSAALTLLLATLLIRAGDSLTSTMLEEWESLLFWSVLVAIVSFFPIPIDDTSLTLDEPILLALALLYPPEVAAVVALFACIDLREFKGQLDLARALYNRVQIGLSVYIAGAAFRSITQGQLDPWPIAIWGTGAAVAAEYLANVLLVSLHVRVRWRLDLQGAVRKLKVGGTWQFLATYLGYGTLALVLAHLFRGVGPWSVAMLVVPILVARQMLIRGQAIDALAEKLRKRDQLLKNLSDRILDERRDERLRVAGELHDETLQNLTQLWLLSSLLKTRNAGSPQSDHLGELVAASEASIDSLRHIIRDLRESPLGRVGLIATVESLVSNARLDWRTKIELDAPATLELPADSQLVVYQVAREALMNALKHSQATLIKMKLYIESGQLMLNVEDNGVGFRPELVDSSVHFGLALMQERVHGFDGQVQIETSPKKGTRVTATFPLEGLQVKFECP
jgi:signal transduction histidine kinase